MMSWFMIEEREYVCQSEDCKAAFRARCRPGVVKYCPSCREKRKKLAARRHNMKQRRSAASRARKEKA